MTNALRSLSEQLARRTSRRSFFGRGADVAFGALAGVAAGTLSQAGVAAGVSTSCQFPGPPCLCARCQTNGVCAKPCIILTQFYASGCWISVTGATCCDCDCQGNDGIHACGCGTDYQNDPAVCPP